MHRLKHWRWLLSLGGLLAVATIVWAQAYNTESRIWDFTGGIRTSVIGPTSTGGGGLDASIEIGGSTTTSIVSTAGGGIMTLDAVGARGTMPATQTIATTNTITADACGGIKRITAASAIGTNTTNTFTATSAAVAGCRMLVCNVGATNTITIDKNAATLLVGGADVALLANSCIGVFNDGTLWRQGSAQMTAT